MSCGCREPKNPGANYVFTDCATDDLQAIYYLYHQAKVPIAGIIVETGVPDAENAIRNILLFRMLFLTPKIKIYRGNLRLVPGVPIEWRLDAKYTQYYLEQLYYDKYGSREYYNPCLDGSYREVNFNGATIYSQGKGTTLAKLVNKYRIKHIYAMMGGETGDPSMPLEFNAWTDKKAYEFLKDYNKRAGIITFYTLQDITQEKVDAAQRYCLSKDPPLYQMIRPSSREGWQFWDLTMVATATSHE